MTIKEKIELRPICNSILSSIIKLQYSQVPGLRFIQVLWILDIIDTEHNSGADNICDRFYEEPYDTIYRVMPFIKALLDEVNTPELQSIKSNIVEQLKQLYDN